MYKSVYSLSTLLPWLINFDISVKNRAQKKGLEFYALKTMSKYLGVTNYNA